MTRDQFHDLITDGEGPRVEFKRSLTKELGRELCAFANADGGVILLGVTDSGRVVGVDKPNRMKSRIQSTARSADPPIDVEIDRIAQVLRVSVPPQDRKPYSFGGRFFKRVGASSQQMSRIEVEDLFYSAGRLHFDRTPCPAFVIERDIDDDIWARFSRRGKIPESMDRIVALQNLGLVDPRQQMTHAGAWIMAQDIRTVTTSAHISCALFLGTTKSRILDRRDFCRDVPSMINDTVTWILSKINVALVISGVRHEEQPELPAGALREAVANAAAHRDYRSTANVHAYVFKDRVEIVSPGGLPAGMTEADLGTKSMPRNPLLFGMLYRMDVVEHIGSGVRRIRDLCRDHGVPDPIFDVSEHWVTVTFPRHGGDDGPELRPECEPEPSEGPEPEQPRPELSEPGPEFGTARATTLEVRSLDDRVMELLADDPLSKSEIARKLGHRSVSGGLNRVIRRLRRAGRIEYTIPEKPTSSRQEYRLSGRPTRP